MTNQKGYLQVEDAENDKLIGDVAEILRSECTSCALGEQTLKLKQYSTHDYQQQDLLKHC